MFGIRLLVSKATFAAQMAELRGWLDAQRYSCTWFETLDHRDKVELAIGFPDAAHANACMERFGGCVTNRVAFWPTTFTQ